MKTSVQVRKEVRSAVQKKLLYMRKYVKKHRKVLKLRNKLWVAEKRKNAIIFSAYGYVYDTGQVDVHEIIYRLKK